MTNIIESKPDKQTTGEFLVSFIFAIILALAFRSFVYEPYRIPSGSMKPTLIVGDHIFVSKFIYGVTRYSLPFSINLIPGQGRKLEISPPKRGDIVVFRGQFNPGITYIKRLIGMPGDKIQVKKGIVYINGQEIVQKPDGYFIDSDGRRISKFIETLPEGASYNVLQDEPCELDNTGIYHVPTHHYFMMGDNRDHSSDSRVLSKIGYVDEKYLVGRAEVIFFSSDSAFWMFWTWLTDLHLPRFFNLLLPERQTL